MRLPSCGTLLLASVVFATTAAAAQDMAGHAHGATSSGARSAACTNPVPACAISATPAFDRDGTLRLIYAVAGRIYVAGSTDDGRTFTPGVPLNNGPADIDDNYDGRPTLSIARDGTIAAAWSVWRDKNWNGTVLFSRSTDGGETFSAPAPITQSVSQRFAAIAFSPTGALWATWIDKRNLAAAKAAGEDYAGGGLAASVSHDAGRTFVPAKIVSDRSCECCRVSLAFDPDGAAVAAWRQIFGKNFRDHEVGRVSPDAATLTGVRVSEDDWAIDVCPHHGPNLSVGADGARHVVWFTDGKTRSGLFYAHDTGAGTAFSAPDGFGDADRVPSHPQVLAVRDVVIRAWKEFDGERTAVLVQSSADGGRVWTAPRAVASTADASDHPILLAKGERPYLSWLTKADGYRLLPVPTVDER